MRLSTIIACVIVVGATAEARSQTQPLTPESYAEFNRIFGATAGRRDPTAIKADQAKTTRLKLPGSGNNLTLDTFTPQNLTNNFGARADIAQTIAKLSTPASINSLLQLSILAPGNKTQTPGANDYFRFWHHVSLDATSVDHVPGIVAGPVTYYQQVGPHRSSRAMALVHLAMFEAANVYSGAYDSMIYGAGLDSFIEPPVHGVPSDKKTAAAIHQAAYEVLAWLYPGLINSRIALPPIDCKNLEDINLGIYDFNLKSYRQCAAEILGINSADYQEGARIGSSVAQRIRALREDDGSKLTEPQFGSAKIPQINPVDGKLPPAQWSPDPVSKIQTALGAYWKEVRPFALETAASLRPGPIADTVKNKLLEAKLTLSDARSTIPSLDAVYEWAAEPLYDAKGNRELAEKYRDGRSIAQFWAYDGTAGLCAPPRLYNQIVDAVIESSNMPSGADFAPIKLRPGVQMTETVDLLRLYALVNIAMADAAIAAWEAKYHYQVARPVTVIRQAQLNDSSDSFPSQWFPLGAQVSNSDGGLNITPPFPAYPSGHASFGGALFGVLRQFYEPGGQFKFISDEFNGSNKDALNYMRCSKDESGNITDRFTSKQFCRDRIMTMTCAERENADSRLTMGVHYIFDADTGITLGNQVARAVVTKVLKRKAGSAVPDADFSAFASDGPQDRNQKSLICPNVTWPGPLSDPMDPKVGFGPFTAVAVKPQ